MEHQASPRRIADDGQAWPAAPHGPAVIDTERDELAGAISMVANGWAAHVLLCGLHSPEALTEALAQAAKAAGVSIRIDHIHNGCIDIVVGPSTS